MTLTWDFDSPLDDKVQMEILDPDNDMVLRILLIFL